MEGKATKWKKEREYNGMYKARQREAIQRKRKQGNGMEGDE